MVPLQPHRRHRFMEASDFTSAARWAHEVFAKATFQGRPVEPVFIGFQMDPVTPGMTLAAKATPASEVGDKFVRSTLAEMHADALLPYGLIAFATPVDTTAPDAAGVQWPLRGVSFMASSVDRTVSTFFEIVHSRLHPRGVRLRYSPLEFVAR
jgi:hypothetical protein